MRRSEALEGVRVLKFKDILGRYEAAEFTQLEAAELLGIGERTFRRWRVRFEDDGAFRTPPIRPRDPRNRFPRPPVWSTDLPSAY